MDTHAGESDFGDGGHACCDGKNEPSMFGLRGVVSWMVGNKG